MIAPRSATIGHLFACCDAMYRVLGERAPELSNDTIVVGLHDASRSLGSVALMLRAQLHEPVPTPLRGIEEVLIRAVAGDASGTMALYAMVAVVGPRFLVTLRDARATFEDDHELHELIDAAAHTTVRVLHQLAEVNLRRSEIDEPVWQATARKLVDMCEVSGNAESWALSR